MFVLYIIIKMTQKASKQSSRGSRGLLRCAYLTTLSLLMPQSAVAQVPYPSTEIKSSDSFSRTEGQVADAYPTYVRFTGEDGLELDLSMPNTRDFDYTVMFWFRSHKSISELKVDDSILNKKAYIFDLPGSASCYVTRTEELAPHIQCTPGEDLKIDLDELPDI